MLTMTRYLGPVPHDASYYSKCLFGGALACGFTHAGITPLDVAKCNMQVRCSSLLCNADVPNETFRRLTPASTRASSQLSGLFLLRRPRGVSGKASALPSSATPSRDASSTVCTSSSRTYTVTWLERRRRQNTKVPFGLQVPPLPSSSPTSLSARSK